MLTPLLARRTGIVVPHLLQGVFKDAVRLPQPRILINKSLYLVERFGRVILPCHPPERSTVIRADIAGLVPGGDRAVLRIEVHLLQAKAAFRAPPRPWDVDVWIEAHCIHSSTSSSGS